MLVYRSSRGLVVEEEKNYYRLSGIAWDLLFQQSNLYDFLVNHLPEAEPIPEFRRDEIGAPVMNQEVWAAGVTYYRSRAARMEESSRTGGQDFYDKVYGAERPELFFKANASRVSGTGEPVRIRRDSHWSVPEPELTLAINASGEIIGYTIGNDMSARDIEGENPLYLPQAKVYSRCCALGPGILVRNAALTGDTKIAMDIIRKAETVFSDTITLNSLKREPVELVRYLFLENKFPYGCFLLTGTGIVPPDEFALSAGDKIRITIDQIGTLENHVEE